jgi:ABC-type transporter Mla subunit MlaD
VLTTLVEFIVIYRRFFIALLLLIVGFVLMVLYVQDVSNTSKEYEVTIDEGDSTRVLTSDEIEDDTTSD